MLVDVQEGYKLWSASYDRDLNPVVSLERRVLSERIGPLRGRRILDIATGTGHWLRYAQSQGARAFGIDLSAHMLAAAAAKPGLRQRLILADINALPIKDGVADLAICSLALGYIPSLVSFFRELARVSHTVIVSDLHESAIRAGWQRSFDAGGRRYHIRDFAHTTQEVDRVAAQSGFQISWRVTSHLGQPEHGIFVRAGRESVFAAACRVPAILSTSWVRL